MLIPIQGGVSQISSLSGLITGTRDWYFFVYFSRFFVAVSILLFQTFGLPCNAQTLTGLGDLPGGDVDSIGLAISGDGLVATGRSRATTGTRAFLWTEENGIAELDFLPDGISSEGLGISLDGSVIVGEVRVQGFGGEPVRWTGETGYLSLGNLGGTGSGESHGVSDDGSVVVGFSSSSNGREAFYWTELGGMVGFGDFFGGNFESESAAVSADGTVVVGYGTRSAGEEAFRWTAETGMDGLGELPGGQFRSRANGISADGSAIVGFSSSDNGDFEAFRWTQETGMVGLGLFEEDLEKSGLAVGFGPHTRANATSETGKIVVGDGYGSTVGHQAFIWNEEGGLRPIISVLADFGVLDTDWRLEEANGVSRDGRKIVGEGFRSGAQAGNSVAEGFLVDFRNLDLHWINNNSGSWDDLSNWIGRFFFPGENDHAIIDPGFSAVVTGPSEPVSIGQLTIGQPVNGNSKGIERPTLGPIAEGFGTTTLSIQPFGHITVNGLTQINMSGVLAGDGFITALGGLQNSGEIDLGQEDLLIIGDMLINNGLIQGEGQIDAVLDNCDSGEIRLVSSERLLLSGATNFNRGEIQVLGGILESQQDFFNESGGFIVGRGAFFFDGRLDNEGFIAFSGGFTDVFGDVANLSGGTIITSGAGTTTFYDDIVNNGLEIRTSASSVTTIFGSVSGSGPFTGFGDVFMEGNLQPGNSPASIFFEGNLTLGFSSTTEFEIGGVTAGSEHDQLMIDGDLSLQGNLSIVPINGFQIESNQQFTIIEVGGNAVGVFNGFAEGDVVGNFGGIDLVISYVGGDGNDIVLATTDVCAGTVEDGVLTISGTNNDDVIVVAETLGEISVTLNDCTEIFLDLTGIVINANAGNDQITVEFPGVMIHGGDGDDQITVNGSGGSVVYGEGGNDVLVGSHGRDELFGGPGDDDIDGRNGNDLIDGGAPPLADPGINTLRGGRGSDMILGGLDVDIISGGDGFDTIFGFDGDDSISGGNGGDEISGGSGNDIISGGAGHDTLNGGGGDDEITGGDGQDLVRGGQGNDTLNGNRSHDIVEGGGGDDTLTGGEGNDELHGGAGFDTATDTGEAGESGIENGP